MLDFAAVLFVFLVLILAALSPTARAIATSAISAIRWLLAPLCALITRLLNRFLGSPTNSDGVRPAKIAQWTLLNILMLILLICLSALYPQYLTAFLPLTVTFWLLHLLVILSAIFVLEEEADIWNGIIGRQDASFAEGVFLKNPSVLFISSLLFVFFTALAVLQFDQISTLRILETRHRFPALLSCTESSCSNLAKVLVNLTSYVEHLLAVMHELPGINWFVKKLNIGNEIRYSGIIGTAFVWIIYSAAWAWIFGVFFILFRQYRDAADLIVALDRAHDQSTIQYLQMRAARAPSHVKSQLLRISINDPKDITRRRAIAIVPHAKIFTFPQTFIYHLHREKNKDIKLWGLKKIDDFVNASRGEFSINVLNKTMTALRFQTGKNRSAHEPAVLKRLYELAVVFSEVAAQRDPKTTMTFFPRDCLLDLAVEGNDKLLRDRAFRLLGQLDPISLCNRLIYKISDIKDDLWRDEALRRCRTVLSSQSGQWKQSQRDAVRDIINRQRRNRDLPHSVKQHLAELAAEFAPAAPGVGS